MLLSSVIHAELPVPSVVTARSDQTPVNDMLLEKYFEMITIYILHPFCSIPNSMFCILYILNTQQNSC